VCNNLQEGYDPNKSKVSDQTMETWRMSQVVADITSVPGIGPAAAAKLAVDDEYGAITNTYQLLAKWLSLHTITEDDEPGSEPDPDLTNQKMWFFLKAKGVHASRSAIVKAINMKLTAYMVHLSSSADDDDDEE
jgi:hypothetical protein